MTDQNYQMDDTQAQHGPATELELYKEVSEPSTEDEFLAENNLGLGKYSDREYWQQIEAFSNHIFTDSAFARPLSEMALYETKWELGKEAVERSDAESAVDLVQEKELVDEDSPIGRRHAITTLGQHRWETLHTEKYGESQLQQASSDEQKTLLDQERLRAVEEHAGTQVGWQTPHGRMISARHEGSRSKDAHLIDNLFGRVKKHKQESETVQKKPDDSGIFSKQ